MNTTRIMDFLSRKNVWEYYLLYNNTQWYSVEEIAQFQLQKLQELVRHCYYQVPFYAKFMRSNDIHPNDIKNLSDLKLFPVMTKEIVKANYAELIPTNLRNISGVKTGQTGGTTGNILFKRSDSNTRSSIWGAFKRFEDWMGYKPYDRALILMGGHVIGHNYYNKLKEIAISLLTNSVSFSPYDTSSKNVDNIIEVMKSDKFSLIRGYCQFLFFLSQKLKRQGITLNVKSITTTAEPLMTEHRKIFREVFNANIFDQYGFGEIGGVAFECEKHEGLHITEERVIVEVQDNNDLVVTDLDNYSMPFIRYWNADQAIISDKYCSCGRKHRLIKKIMGRSCDYLLGTNGEFLHWAYFWHLIFDSNIAINRKLEKFQIRQVSSTELIFRYIADTFSKKDKELLSGNIQEHLGPIQVTFVKEENIENAPSGKYRPVVNKILK